MQNLLVYLFAAVYAVVGLLAGYGFVLALMTSKGAIQEIDALLLLLCAMVSLVAALIAVQLARIDALLRNGQSE